MQGMKRPTQKRGKETFGRILAAAASVLAAEGIRGLNTNRIAEVAAVTPPTVYRYFDDKVDILVGLAEEFVAQEQLWLQSAQETLGASFTPAQWVEAMVSGYWDHAQRFTGLPELRQAMKTYDALAPVEEQSLKLSAQRTSAVLAVRFGLSNAAAARVARFVIETTCSTVDRSYALPTAEARVRLRELKKMLSLYLEGCAADASR